ncbi:MAG: hypothetical protein M3Q93_05140, partial [Gemmatimonadota bacterium]|nr:hypothetical protein [Gemmatimonadota bacterium]
MNFRSRAFAALTVAALVPLAVLAFGVRREMSRRLLEENARRGEGAVAALREELSRQSESVAARLSTLGAELQRDNRLRLALVGREPAARRVLLDLAGGAMRAAGLDLLQIQDSAGRILSSGQFRNAFDRVEPALPRALAAAGAAPVLVRARTPETSIVVLARLDSVRIAGARLTLAGGVEVEAGLRRQLARDPDLSVDVVYPGFAPAAVGDLTSVAALPLVFIDLAAAAPAPVDTARLIVSRAAGTLAELRRSIDRWFLAALAATVALALAAAGWLAARISRPLT